MAKDPYKYFRIEARELLDGLSEGILQLEKGTASPDAVARLLRLGHTLKGAARVVKQPAIAELAHRVEERLASERESQAPMAREQSNELLALIDEARSLLGALDGPAEAAAAQPVPRPTEQPLETVRVDVEEMDSLLRGVSEAGVQLAALRTRIRSPKGADDVDALLADADRVGVELGEIRDAAHRLRLIPAHTVFPMLERTVRDAAQALDKRVEFRGAGGDIRLDANVLASLRDPLMHVVRNAVAHGIEQERDRAAVGKQPVGQVRLDIERRGSRVAFVCHDDGRGVDVDAVKEAAVARRLLSASDARSLTAEQAAALLLTGGFTTSRDVTELSGRGIGLDVVRSTAMRLKGDVHIRSEPGRGTTVEVQVPVSIASLVALIVEAGGARAAIPIDAIRHTLRIDEGDVSRAAHRDSIVHDGAPIPFLPLDETLGYGPAARRARRIWSAVVVEHDAQRVAVGVDRLAGTSSVVMQSLPDLIGVDVVVAGASIDGEGNPLLVLDPGGLIAAGDRGRATGAVESMTARAPILVIDDSLTTRMLEQTILESAGYEVEVAVSAEDALAKARERDYRLFIVDVEMPGMSGFEFVEHTRADPGLRHIPAILVTSRNAPEDRRRGAAAGASAYIVKSEFDQGHLLHTISGLIEHR